MKLFALNYIIIQNHHQYTGRCLTLSLAGTEAVFWGKVPEVSVQRAGGDAALILPPEADQCWSEISPLSASEIFTQRRVRRIGTGFPHANGSVKEATGSSQQ